MVKKAARGAVMLSAWTARRIIPGTGVAKPSVRVLTYHRFGEGSRDPWCVRADVFEAQVRWLSERKRAVSLNDVVRFSNGETELPEGAVLITSDDGFSSVATIAAPILAKYQVPAVAFITTSAVGKPSVEPDDPYMTWDQIARLGEAGIAVGSHSHRHVSLGRLPLARAREEAEHSRILLQERTGLTIDSFAYPFGMHADETPQTRQVLAEAGYRSVFIAQHGVVRPGTDLLRIPRLKVEGGEPAWMFQFLCEGGMDVWKAVDDSLWRLQRPEPGRDPQ
jgi:peptidoglycan/xylan/chitin deacetylase (PgdA/CDA1 family)